MHVENNTSLQTKESRKRAYDDQDKNDDLGKRLCNNNRTSSTTSKNLFPAVASISKIPENKWSPGRYKNSKSRKFVETKKPCYNQNNNPKKLKFFHNDWNQASTTQQSRRQSFKSFKTGETMSRNLDCQNNATLTTPKPMSFTCLKNLCDDQVPPEDASSRLCEHAQLQRFEALLQENEIRYDLMKLIIHVIYKVCQSRMPTHVNIILGVLNKVQFWSTLGRFIVELETRKECLTDPNVSSILKHLCEILSISIERLPYLYSWIPLHQLQSAVSFLKENGKVPIDCTIDSLLTDVAGKCELVKKGIREKEQSQAEPPDNFRLLSVFPTTEDIFKKGKPFLRENIVKKPFSSVDQYLDIHFRLLKEDSLAGLRNGIWNLRKSYQQQQYGQAAVNSLSKSSNDRSQKDIIVYHDVMIKEPVWATNRRVHTTGIVYNVVFNSEHPSIKRMNWARSKRLKFGSLVCLISADFKKVHFATVQDRDADMLKEGFIQLCFEGNDCPGDNGDMQEKYRMVESNSAYFVAYRHILQRLQDINEKTMPFKNYIVFCEHEIDKVTLHYNPQM